MALVFDPALSEKSRSERSGVHFFLHFFRGAEGAGFARYEPEAAARSGGQAGSKPASSSVKPYGGYQPLDGARFDFREIVIGRKFTELTGFQ